MKRSVRFIPLSALAIVLRTAHVIGQTMDSTDFFGKSGAVDVVTSAAADAKDLLFGGPATSAYNMRVNLSDTLTIGFYERPLSFDNGMLQTLSGGTASHVQIVAKNSKGVIVDNFGLTGETTTLLPQKTAIEIETPTDIVGKYNQTPIGVVQLSATDYIGVRDEVMSMARQGRYAPLGGVDLAGDMLYGAMKGLFEDGSAVSAVARAVRGAIDADSQYDAGGNRNAGAWSDPSDRMSVPVYNCHYLALLFLSRASERPSFKLLEPYHIPGDRKSDVTGDSDDGSGTIPEPSGRYTDGGDVVATPVGPDEGPPPAVPEPDNPVETPPTPTPEDESFSARGGDDEFPPSADAPDAAGTTPKDVVKQFIAIAKEWIAGTGNVYTDTAKRDDMYFNRLAALCTPDSRDDLELMFLGMAMTGREAALASLESVMFGKCTIEGDDATVGIVIRDVDGAMQSTDLALRKMDGTWKLHISIDEHSGSSR